MINAARTGSHTHWAFCHQRKTQLIVSSIIAAVIMSAGPSVVGGKC